MRGLSGPRSAMTTMPVQRGGGGETAAHRRLDRHHNVLLLLAPPHVVVPLPVRLLLVRTTAALLFFPIAPPADDYYGGSAIPRGHAETPDISPRGPENCTIVRGAKSNKTTTKRRLTVGSSIYEAMAMMKAWLEMAPSRAMVLFLMCLDGKLRREDGLPEMCVLISTHGTLLLHRSKYDDVFMVLVVGYLRACVGHALHHATASSDSAPRRTSIQSLGSSMHQHQIR